MDKKIIYMQKNSKNILPVSVIVTVLNEEKTIKNLLQALAAQTKLPSEVVIVDGGSTDTSFIELQTAVEDFPTRLIIRQRYGNRSVGRNYAIEISSQSVIACTDAGCIPESNWLEQLYKQYIETRAPVIGGYYKGIARTNFEAAVIPYALVMPDKVDEKNFLPATRSMLFEKKVWRSVEKFNESLSDNEDYAFARKLKQKGIKIGFARTAVVQWQPRSTLQSFYWMIFRFARGDMQAAIIRPKVLLIFARYMFGSGIYIFLLQNSFGRANLFLLSVIFLYGTWAVFKNSKYAPRGWFWLPILQMTSDVAVLHGSLVGVVRLFNQF